MENQAIIEILSEAFIAEAIPDLITTNSDMEIEWIGGKNAKSFLRFKNLAEVFESLHINHYDYESLIRIIKGQNIKIESALNFVNPAGQVFAITFHKREDGNLQFAINEVTDLKKQDIKNKELAKNITTYLSREDIYKKIDDIMIQIREITDHDRLSQDILEVVKKVSRLINNIQINRSLVPKEDESDEAFQDRVNKIQNEIITSDIACLSVEELRDRPYWINFLQERVENGPSDVLENIITFVRNAIPFFVSCPDGKTVYLLNSDYQGEYDSLNELLDTIGNRNTDIDIIVNTIRKAAYKPQIINSWIGDKRYDIIAKPSTFHASWQATFMPREEQRAVIDIATIIHDISNKIFILDYIGQKIGRKESLKKNFDPKKTYAILHNNFAKLELLAKGQEITKTKENILGWFQDIDQYSSSGVNIACSGLEELKDKKVITVPDTMKTSIEQLIENAIQNHAKNINFEVQVQGQILSIQVSDDGQGMSKSQIEKLETVILSEKAISNLSTRENGTGIGILGIAKAVKQIKGGNIMVESEEGEGATFTLTMEIKQE